MVSIRMEISTRTLVVMWNTTRTSCRCARIRRTRTTLVLTSTGRPPYCTIRTCVWVISVGKLARCTVDAGYIRGACFFRSHPAITRTIVFTSGLTYFILIFALSTVLALARIAATTKSANRTKITIEVAVYIPRDIGYHRCCQVRPTLANRTCCRCTYSSDVCGRSRRFIIKLSMADVTQFTSPQSCIIPVPGATILQHA